MTTCTTPSGTMKASLQRGGLQVRPSSDPLSPVSEVHGILTRKDLPTNGNSLYSFESLLNTRNSKKKKRFLIPAFEVFARLSMALGSSFINPSD